MKAGIAKTGQICPVRGLWEFDVFTDGTGSPPPTPGEQSILMLRGTRFPPCRSACKGVYRRLLLQME